MPSLADDFQPALGLGWTHTQSLYGVFARARKLVPMRRERRTTPDGDFVDIDIALGQPHAPSVVILHGLEGSSLSGYVQHLMQRIVAKGWTAMALNARSCSGEPNLQAASYSSGDYRDVSWLVQSLEGTVYAVGFSLGASVLLNFLTRDEGAQRLHAAVAVSTPFSVAAAAAFLDSGTLMSNVYLRYFLPKMKTKVEEKVRRMGSQFPIDIQAVRAVTRVQEFDELVTAPLFGFRSAHDYYEQCSTQNRLQHIRTPTLLLSSHDDALAPPHLPTEATHNKHLHVLLTQHGGHVGFVGGTVLRPQFWAEDKVVQWLHTQM